VHTKEDAAVLKNNFKVCRWEDVRCGDILYLEEGDHFPADMILLMSSEENGECFV
jgi:phospholipid-translocating ATPase